MLIHLRIRNFALIEQWQVDFETGESVMTGETGSGKSIFVDAVSFLTGSRMDRKIQRNPDVPTLVEAAFHVDESCAGQWAELGIESEDGLLVVSRQMNEKGTQARINQRIVTQSTLKRVMESLVDIHSQNAQSLLSDRKNYRRLLDEYVGENALTLKKRLHEQLKQLQNFDRRLTNFDLSPEERQREMDLLRYQISEIQDANLPGTDETALNAEYRLLSSALERKNTLQRLTARLSGGREPLKYALQSMAQELDELVEQDSALADMRDLCWQMQVEAESLQDDLVHYTEEIQIDPQRIEELDLIFQSLFRLKRKYGDSIEHILRFQVQCETRLSELSDAERYRKELLISRERCLSELQVTADALSAARCSAAKQLESRIRQELSEMAIRRLSFEIAVCEEPQIGTHGKDSVDFRISTNPGEPMQSVSEVASGGEMSRFMLALKIVLAQTWNIDTLLFDEIDTGISGRTAQVVGEKLVRLARSRQMIVITHLPQIAALADHHFLIQKRVEKGITRSAVTLLSDAQRIEEQARLIGGVQITDRTRESAREMLEQAKELLQSKDASNVRTEEGNEYTSIPATGEYIKKRNSV